MPLEPRTAVHALVLEDVNDVAACKDHNRVPILTDFFVRLSIQVGGSDQDSELAVP